MGTYGRTHPELRIVRYVNVPLALVSSPQKKVDTDLPVIAFLAEVGLSWSLLGSQGVTPWGAVRPSLSGRKHETPCTYHLAWRRHAPGVSDR
jgi:hypothetical protein